MEPGIQARQVHGGGGQDVLEVGLGQSEIPAAAQPEATDALRQSTFDAGAAGVALLPGFGVLFRAPGLQRFMLKTRVDRQQARPGLRPCTDAAARAGRTGGRGKADANDRVAAVIAGFRPAIAGLAERALGVALGPVDRERADVEAVCRPGMAAGVRYRRPDQRDGVLGRTGDQPEAST